MSRLAQSSTSRSGAPARSITVLSTLILAALGCGFRIPPAATQPPTSSSSNATAQPAGTAAPSQTPSAAPARLWACQRCGGNAVWELTAQGVEQVELPVQMGQYYDYSITREAILYASHFADAGAGPANIAVSDLWVLDVASGEAFELVASDTVVEALWMPDGGRAAFIEAVPDTYQLVVSDLNGRKSILAQDVAFTWGISPDGKWIAFTRESRYGLPGEPGLYSVEVSTGQERQLSDLDRAGTGSIDDQPYWSLDSQWVLFPVLSGISSAMDLSRPDGSRKVTLSFDPALADLLWYDHPVSSALWLPGGFRFLGQARVSGGDQMGGPDRLVLYELNSDRTAIIEAHELGELNAFIGWQEPGNSAWILSPNSDRPVLFSVP